MSEASNQDEVLASILVEIIHAHPIINEALNYVTETHAKKEYHNIRHTHDVIQMSLTLCLGEDMPEEDRAFVIIAAVYHDYFQGPGHEEKNAEIVRQKMTKEGYKEEDIKKVEGGIRSTKVDPESNTRKKPSNIIEEIIQDSDIVNFGRGDNLALFFSYHKELVGIEYEFDAISSKIAFLQKTISIMNNHRWNTQSAKSLYEKQKEKNLAMLRDELKSLEAQTG